MASPNGSGDRLPSSLGLSSILASIGSPQPSPPSSMSDSGDSLDDDGDTPQLLFEDDPEVTIIGPPPDLPHYTDDWYEDPDVQRLVARGYLHAGVASAAGRDLAGSRGGVGSGPLLRADGTREGGAVRPSVGRAQTHGVLGRRPGGVQFDTPPPADRPRANSGQQNELVAPATVALRASESKWKRISGFGNSRRRKKTVEGSSGIAEDHISALSIMGNEAGLEPAMTEDGAIYFRGRLFKRGGRWKSWTHRYCILDRGIFFYYEAKSDTPNLKGSFSVHGAVAMAAEDSKFRKPNAFTISTTEREWVMYAETAGERDQWVEVINMAAEAEPIINTSTS